MSGKARASARAIDQSDPLSGDLTNRMIGRALKDIDEYLLGLYAGVERLSTSDKGVSRFEPQKRMYGDHAPYYIDIPW